MNPRILKKLCKRIVDIGHPVAKGAWLDDEEPIGGFYIGGWRSDAETAIQKRSLYMTKTTVKSIYVLGGGTDYWGEGSDPEPVFYAAKDYVLWEIGKPKIETERDENGEVIAEFDGWPETNKRLTGAFVIKFLRDEMKRAGVNK